MAVTKIIEVVGSSPTSSDDAVRAAIVAASRSLRGISRAEVLAVECAVRDGQVSEWQVRVKIAFPVEPRAGGR